jgi:hypothetical protein
MSLTSFQAARIGEVVRVTVASSLTAPTYYWYADGAYVGSSTDPHWTFQVPLGTQLVVDVVDTTDEDFDPYGAAPTMYPAVRTLWWVRSLTADVTAYRVYQQRDEGDWTRLADVASEPDRWDYQYTTERLDDLIEYAWQVVALDAAGNEGPAELLDAEMVVRTPDGVAFTATLEEDGTVTFALSSE